MKTSKNYARQKSENVSRNLQDNGGLRGQVLDTAEIRTGEIRCIPALLLPREHLQILQMWAFVLPLFCVLGGKNTMVNEPDGPVHPRYF